MDRETLLSNIHRHENQAMAHEGGRFKVVEVIELADGILAVREDDGEHTVYFDKGQYQMKEGSAFEDVSPQILNFPEHTGFLEDVTARSWAAIQKTAKRSMRAMQGEIAWHKKAIALAY